MISFLQHQALVGDIFPMRRWASKEMSIPCPLPLFQASGSILLLLSGWHLWFLALGAAGDVWFENFRLKFPGALVISRGLYDTHEWLTLSILCLHLQKYLKNTLLFKIHQGTWHFPIAFWVVEFIKLPGVIWTFIIGLYLRSRFVISSIFCLKRCLNLARKC